MKKILVMTNYTILPGEPGYNRFRYLCEMLADNGKEVTLITSIFNHYNKKIRDCNDYRLDNIKYKIKLIKECGYKKNISLKRIISQRQFARNLSLYLEHNGENYDILYACVPSLEAAKVMGEYAKRNNKKFIIDVQDLWPEAMKMITKSDKLNNLVFYKMKKSADYVYSLADSIIAVSNTYLERALQVNKKAINNTVVYIGTNFDEFENGVLENSNTIEKNQDEFWITYIGTLGHSYDISTVMDAIKIVNDKGFNNIKFKIFGRGPSEAKLKEYRDEINSKAEFMGYINYKEMAAFLKMSDIGINCIVKNSAASIINKVGDYFTAGLPVLNSSVSLELRNMIEDYELGLNYEAGNPNELAECILKLYDNKRLIEKARMNSYSIANKRFNRSESYMNINSIIDTI